jgi:FixJ family two-component response regulator
MPTTAKSAVSAAVKHRPRVLLVDDEPGLVDVLGTALGGMNCNVTVAANLAAAGRALAAGGCDLLVVDVGLPDGSGLSLLPVLHRCCPAASAIVITGSPTVAGAVTALRDGAVDFLPKPFDYEQIVERVTRALDRQAAGVRAAARLVRLRGAVRRLSAARRTVSQKVDLLCNDLIGAYTDLAKQVDSVRLQENFRKHIATAGNDLEQLLCHAMDWFLRQLGPANVGLWLASDDGVFQLGAYMKHTVPGDDPVVEAMRDFILPAAARDGVLHCPGSNLPGKLSRAQRSTFAKQDVAAVSATYLGEPLATLVFFRDAASAFTDEDLSVLRAVTPVFATTLAAVVREPSAVDDDALVEDATGTSPFADGLIGDDDDREEDNRPESWWKRGEPPPF